MKIISWNVNGIRAVERKGDLEVFLNQYDPDIFLIQETKAKAEQVNSLLKKYDHYEQFYNSAERPGYAGTAIWVKKTFRHSELDSKSSIKFQTGMPPFDDTEGRISRITIGNIEILGVYFPNGGKSPEAWEGKLIFYEKFFDFVNQLRKEGKTVIFAGDVNCAHEEIDLARPKDNEGSIGFHPAERKWLSKWIENGWIDVWRKRNPHVRDVYSWWHVITRSRAKNVGWRIDYFFVDEKFVSQIKDIRYLNDQMGSDHCPILLEM